MRQVLFWIPLHSVSDSLPDIPIYGYGTMLFLAFILCTWLAGRLAEKQGVPKERMQDLAIWLFVFGIVGARITYITQDNRFTNFFQYFAIWDGGLVFYGGFIGGVVGYFAAYFAFLRRYGISSLKLIDIIAPTLALGICLGRIGCLLNGCCYGQVACPHCPAVTFPPSAASRYMFVNRGLQTMGGFTLDGPDSQTVGKVEPGSPAASAGLRDGDMILRAQGKIIKSPGDLLDVLVFSWQRGRTDLSLAVLHADHTDEVLPPFYPRTVGLHPAQVYESISMFLLFVFLLLYYPMRRRPGSLMAIFLMCYAVHRFLNEMLRTDTADVAFDMTLSQNISVLVFLSGAFLGIYVWWPRLDSEPLDANPPNADHGGESQPGSSTIVEGTS